ncbi:FadR/GntR family transcriptional regulator [Hyalangium rubrum]|uniref:GntR family transcriptional regulator n=1 Tax=Hyalangium rubrum TaxID=3103134 RepID=A0ABU5GZ59_9BACT|nr:GntR family transcriptional regulator [Hyalangium sp. s54d21]MDY7226440.1 GntR family transcriptional regulator [Hyalangium sp. s54d21]
MERMGLVWRVEQDLERIISLGQLPKGGQLPGEQTLAQRYGVSRATVREALLRLAARGLVVQHPGRKSRAVALEQALTLENLSVALHAQSQASPQSRQLLEGFWALKRETAVEVLSACCEHSSEADLKRLLEACLLLEEAVRWEPQPRWAQREFELLRLAARTAERPGHLLLLQSLERSFWGMVDRAEFQLDSQAVLQWAKCAYEGLSQRDAQALRRQLPALLQASDERLLSKVWPAHDAPATPQALPMHMPPGTQSPARLQSARDELPEAASAKLPVDTTARAYESAKEDSHEAAQTDTCVGPLSVPGAPEYQVIPAQGTMGAPAGGELHKPVWLSDRFLTGAGDGPPCRGASSPGFGAPPGALGSRAADHLRIDEVSLRSDGWVSCEDKATLERGGSSGVSFDEASSTQDPVT